MTDWISFFAGVVSTVLVFAAIAIIAHTIEENSKPEKNCDNPHIPLIDRQRKAMKK